MHELIQKITSILRSKENRQYLLRQIRAGLSREGQRYISRHFETLFEAHLAPIVDRLEFNVPKNSYFWDPRYVEQQVKKTNDLFIKNTVDLVCKMYPRRDQRYTSMTVLGPESIRESRNTLYNGETKYGTMDGRDQTDLEDPAFLYGGQHMRPLKNKGPQMAGVGCQSNMRPLLNTAI